MSGIGEWNLETGGTLGEGSEQSPVMYPRSEVDRAQSNNNKGGASVDSGPGTVKYGVGPYPEAEIAPEDEADMEGSGTA
jgi:hypothetical protein